MNQKRIISIVLLLMSLLSTITALVIVFIKLNSDNNKNTNTNNTISITSITPSTKPSEVAPSNTIIPTNTVSPTIKSTVVIIRTNTPKPTSIPIQSCNSSFNTQLLALINDYRTQNGKNALIMDSKLNAASCNHSIWMNSTKNLSHTGENDCSPWDRCAKVGSSCDAENIAMNPNPSALNIFTQWKNSSGHNANMLGDHTKIGMGLSGYYATNVYY